jgi:tetratricopeptide (TPR) repeat protein
MPIVSVVFLARELGARGALAAAIRMLEAALLARPESALLAMELGKAHKDAPARDLRAAQLAFCAAAHNNPQSSGAWMEYGRSSLGLREWERGIQAMRKAVEANADNWLAQRMLSRALLQEDRTAISPTDRQEAIELMRRTTLLEPSLENYVFVGDMLLLRIRDLDGAAEAYRNATRQTPEDAEAR